MSKKEIQKLTSEYSQNPVTRKIERVACYIRVSTEEQKLHGISLDSQRDKLREYANKHHLKIVEWYEDEGVSGRKLIRKRPELQRMLHDAQAGKFDRILFIKLDRFFRSVAEYHECMKLIDPVLWTATEEKYDLTTANGRAFVNMKLTIAELEADQTGERIKIVNEYKVKTGQALIGSQSQGIGYKVEKDKEGVKRVVKDPETKDVVNDFINHFLTYNNKRQALLYINDKYNTNYTYGCFIKILHDTKIYGHYRGNDNYCEPYVDKATFDKIQEMLKANIKTRKNKVDYLYTGLIRCPKCGKKLAGSHRVKQNKSGKATYKYYRCNHAYLNAQCEYRFIVSEAKIEAALLDNIEKYMADYIAETIEDNSTQGTHAEDRVKSLNEELRKTNRMYKNGALTDDEYDKEVADIKERLDLAKASLKPLKKRDLTIYKEMLNSDWKTLYNGLNDINKRAFWRKYIQEIKLDEKGNLEAPLFF